MTETIEPKFKIGDVVTLNSQSDNPKMTVKLLVMQLNPRTSEYDLFYGIVKCSWFDQTTLKEDKFHQDMLKLVVKN